MVDLLNSVMNLVVPPATMVVMAFSWPLLSFISFSERLYNSYFATEDMEDKVVVITGASSAIGEVLRIKNNKLKELIYSPPKSFSLNHIFSTLISTKMVSYFQIIYMVLICELLIKKWIFCVYDYSN